MMSGGVCAVWLDRQQSGGICANWWDLGGLVALGGLYIYIYIYIYIPTLHPAGSSNLALAITSPSSSNSLGIFRVPRKPKC